MILLETHIWVWWVDDTQQLADGQRHLIQDNVGSGLEVSAISCREVAKLVQYGRLELACPLEEWMALALAQEEAWWLLIKEQRALTCARQRGLKPVTVPELIVYLYQAHMLSYRSALCKLDKIAPNTGQRVMQAARHTFLGLAQRRGER